MKRIIFLAAFSLLLTSNPLKAQSILDFVLVNETGEDLYGFYISEVSDQEWGNDIMPEDILENGHEVHIKFTDSDDTDCHWDIKLTKDASEKTSVTIGNANLCHISKVFLSKKGVLTPIEQNNRFGFRALKEPSRNP